MKWITQSNGINVFHGTTVTGGKFAIAEGVTAQDLLAFAEQMEKSMQPEANDGQSAPSERLNPKARAPV